MDKGHSRRLLWSVEYVAIVLMCTVLLGVMGCKQESDPLSSEKAILSLTVTGRGISSPVNAEVPNAPIEGEEQPQDLTRVIAVPALPAVSDLSWIILTFKLSDGAKIEPASGGEYDFSDGKPKDFTVTAEDGTSQRYLVTINGVSTKDITAFTLGSGTTTVGTGTLVGETITVQVPPGTDFTNLVPTITHGGASVSPLSGVGRDFTNPVTYTVTALDGSPKDYTVVVKVEDQAVGISIDLVNDDIVTLFGITANEAKKDKGTVDLYTKGIELFLPPSTSRREAVISLTGFTNSGNNNAGDAGVNWSVDGYSVATDHVFGNAQNIFMIKAENYTIGRHWVEVTGKKEGVWYSKTFYFTVDK